MHTDESPDAAYRLSEELRGVEQQLASLTPLASADWQAQVMFEAGLKRGRQLTRQASWKVSLGAACLAASLSTWATMQWLPRPSSVTVRQLADATDRLIAANALLVPSSTSAPSSTSWGIATEKQLDDLLARHLPTRMVIDSPLPAEFGVVQPDALPTLFEYRQQLRESL